MTRHLIYLLLGFLPFVSCKTPTETIPFNGTQSNQPASKWEEAMVTGNGNMGAMMYGNPFDETIVVNHCEMFLTLGTKEFVKHVAPLMPEIKEKALAAGVNGPTVAHQMFREKTSQKIDWTDPFHPAFIFHIKNADRAYKNYQLTQNFATGELKASWDDDEGHWERKLFISRPDDVIVMEITGPKGKVGGCFSMDLTHNLIETETQVIKGEIKTHATYVHGKGGYDNVVRIIPTGGEMTNDKASVTVSQADRILVVMQVDNWKTPLPESQSEVWAYSPKNPKFLGDYSTNKQDAISEKIDALTLDYATLFKIHAQAHGELFNRVKLNLNGNQTETLSSQDLLEEAAQSGQFTPSLAEKIYDACRYLIICSTGKNPPNLQGIWTGTWKPAWSGDYTLDSNLQLEVQSIMSSNMPELMENYFTLIESWLVDSRLNAKKFYGCRGITSNPRASNTNLLLHWGNWPGEQSFGTMGWMLHFFYDYYQFTGDTAFLKDRVVPLLKENALFYEDLLKDTEDENGKYQFFISYSPEQDHYLYANSTFDISVAKAVLTYLVKSCKVLNIEEKNIVKWQKMISKLPDYMVNEKGELMEWASAGTQEVYNQRHHSHLLPLYQFCEFDKETNPQLWEASAKALEGKTENWLHNRKNADSNHITHGMMNQAQAAARLGKSDIVYEVLSRMATEQYIYPSFMMSYWPNKQGYGFDPIGTIPDVINNALAFAWEDVLDIIPALPKEWPKGDINNILLRGQVQIDKLTWNMETGELKLKMTSKKDKTMTMRLPEKYEVNNVMSGESEMERIQGKYKNKWLIELSQNKPRDIIFKLE